MAANGFFARWGLRIGRATVSMGYGAAQGGGNGGILSVKVYWAADDPSATSFQLDKSTDGGESYVALSTLGYNTRGPNYEAKTKRFFYDDTVGNPGDIYKLTVTGTYGTSEPLLIVAPPYEPAKCLVIGYIRDVFGGVDRQVTIIVEGTGSKGQRWAPGSGGVVSRNPEGIGLKMAQQRIFPDAAGMWQVELIRGTYARIQIPDLQFSFMFEVPSKAGPVNIRDIPELRGQALELFRGLDGEPLELPES